MPTLQSRAFVSAAWLAARRHSTGGAPLRLVDCRWRPDGAEGQATYLQGHLPGAVFVDLDTELAGPPTPHGGQHPLPDPDDFAAAMGRAGVGDDTTVVAYDTSGGVIAARLVWMLRAIGRPAAVLDGGLASWDQPLEAGPVEVQAATFTPCGWPHELFASADEVAESLRGGGLVVDTRDAAQYRGEPASPDPRPGHIPGARSLPFADMLTDRGQLRPNGTLRAAFIEIGAATAADVVVYCHSGVTACHQALVMQMAGIARLRVYVGSWSAWSSDPARPSVTGSHPGSR